MKKSFFLGLASLLLVSLSLLSQSPPPDWQLKVLTERPVPGQMAQLEVFYTTTSALEGRDSINLEKRQVIHFQPQPIQIDNILDTISVLSDYLDREDLILSAYRWPGRPVWLVDNHSERYGSWLGFYPKKVLKTDTTKFVYKLTTYPSGLEIKVVEVSRKRSIEIDNHPNYWLIGAWGVFLGFIVLAIIFWSRVNRIMSHPNREPAWQSRAMIILISIWIIALARIIFSGSILILLIPLVTVVGIGIVVDKKRRSNLIL